jgi:mRNA interferase HicA
VKRRDLERSLRDLGWWFLRAGGSHDVWTNGKISTTVPRHNEIKEMTAKGILDKATKNPANKK